MIDKPGCMEALKEVERLLDGELEGELRIKVEKHLSGCSPCMDRAEFRRHLKAIIGAAHPRASDHRGTRRLSSLMPYHSVPSR